MTEPLIDDARRLHLELRHRIVKLSARPNTRPMAMTLLARARAIERELQREAELSVEEVRTEAIVDAIAERWDEARGRDAILEANLGRLAEKSGVLRAERTRIEARLAAERVAATKTQELLDLRLKVSVSPVSKRVPVRRILGRSFGTGRGNRQTTTG
jgi:hypothetical protein